MVSMETHVKRNSTSGMTQRVIYNILCLTSAPLMSNWTRWSPNCRRFSTSSMSDVPLHQPHLSGPVSSSPSLFPVMASPRWSTSMLLASLILLLYWTTSSARSHDSTSTDLSALDRFKRILPEDTKDKTEKVLNVVKDSLSVMKDVVDYIGTDNLAGVLKGISGFASLAPGIGTLVSSIIVLVLVFIPQRDPLNEGFAEVNRKLDLLSIQISNLATDVEWFSYASVYSQDEVRILNAWKKLTEFRENSGLVKTAEDRLRLAEIFTNYYENTAVEASVANLYHYLTVSSTSLSGNLNDLLRKKFKCSIREIGKYNIYFSSLLWRGMVLNQLYWNLIGFNPSDKEAEQTQMLKNVSEAQISAVKFCLKNYKEYMEKDVEEISKAMNPDDKTAIADQVKKALDKKYNWYNWVVLVHNTGKDKKHIFYNMKEFPVGKITVAVGYTQKTKEEKKEEVIKQLSLCYKQPQRQQIGKKLAEQVVETPCDNIAQEIPQCSRKVADAPVSQFVKVMHASFKEKIAKVPDALQSSICLSSNFISKIGEIHIYYSRTLPVCAPNPCKNKGKCERLLDSNEWLCNCPDGFYGDTCEKIFKISKTPVADKLQPVPDISTIDNKLVKMESKLEEVLNTIKEQRPRQ
ncbi:SE-cephalotoxin-like protein [Lates japonicus]|uniref:SE-cephalotoxin-like protein n=1 Tax=Lates japonicus TaxID=270547 RepID=A0AAD3RHE8_LATJO|nr:SE-cephalotoxin-like protein [Lates japonicus]